MQLIHHADVTPSLYSYPRDYLLFVSNIFKQKNSSTVSTPALAAAATQAVWNYTICVRFIRLQWRIFFIKLRNCYETTIANLVIKEYQHDTYSYK